jgi:hypothetical protein
MAELRGRLNRGGGGNDSYAGGVDVDGGVGVPVAVDVAVEVAVGVGVGEWNVNLGVGVAGDGETAGCDGDRFTLVGETDAAATGGGALLDGGVLMAGDSPEGAPLGVPASPVAVALAEPGEPLVPAAADRGECDPVSASTATIPVAMIATRTPTAAAAPDSANIRRRGARIAWGKPLGRNGPAPCVTSRR